MNKRLFKYELINLAGNPFIIAFGLILPLIFSILIPKTILPEIPEMMQKEVITNVLIAMSTYIPLCLALIGHGSIYSQENEKKIPQRLNLFGISKKNLILSKVLSQLLVLVVALLFFWLIVGNMYKITLPTLQGAVIYMICMILLTAFLLMYSHGVADIICKFGPSYALIMLTYFIILFLSGDMGLRYEMMPRFMQRMADLLPTSHLGEKGYQIWTSTLSNYAPLVQSFIFLGAFCGIILLASVYKTNKNKI